MTDEDARLVREAVVGNDTPAGRIDFATRLRDRLERDGWARSGKSLATADHMRTALAQRPGVVHFASPSKESAEAVLGMLTAEERARVVLLLPKNEKSPAAPKGQRGRSRWW